jgi:putative redox protein
MITLKTSYSGNLRTTSVHIRSNQTIITDAPIDNNGRGEAFSPTDLVCASLASCMMTIMGIKANKEGLELKNLEAEVTKVMSLEPRKISKIVVSFTWKSIQGTPAQHQLLKQAALTCPVALSLDPAIQQEVSFNF